MLLFWEYWRIYEFTHCTFANYWNRSFRSTPAVILNDYVPISETEDFVMPLEKAVFANCIIDGNQTVEFGVEQKGDQELSFLLTIQHCAFHQQTKPFMKIPIMILALQVYTPN